MVYTIKDAWPQLVAYYERLQDYQSSVAQCRMVADYFGPTRRIDAITFADVEEFQNHLLTVVGNKPSTVNAKIAKLRLMRQLAIRNGATNMPPMPANVTAKHVKKALWTADEQQPVWHFAPQRRASLNIFEQQVRRSLHAAGLKKRRPIHTLRDTCLSRLGQAGCTGFEIMQWSGHKDLKSVAIYVQMDTSRLDRMKSLLAETTCTPTL